MDSFVLYTNYYDILKDLPDEDTGALFKAILCYTKTGSEPKLKERIKIAFAFIKNQLDLDKDKYNKKVERLRENGRKGGLAKAGKEEIEEDSLANLANAKIAKHNDNVNNNVNVNDNVLSQNVEKVKVEIEERKILENYVKKNKLAKKNVSAYVSKIIENGDHIRILEEEKRAIIPKKTRKEQIEEDIASVVDKRSCARALYKYYRMGEFPPDELDKISEQYDLDSYDKLYEYSKELEEKKNMKKEE